MREVLDNLKGLFPVSANVFGDVAVECMTTATNTLAMASVNIEKHQEFQQKMVTKRIESNLKIRRSNLKKISNGFRNCKGCG